ncbi:hypothetical protein XI09_00970 [Bradyrhizobium sp. CCBAU 11386]|nr:hypothetical protein [Bradyrhizobium sp. CCBAU 11386]
MTRDLQTSQQEPDSVLRLLQHAREQWINIAEAAENESEKLQKSLQEERARGQRLEQELALARRDLELQATLTSRPGNESTELKQAAERELQKVTQQERDRTIQLEQDLAVARRELETQSTQAAKVTAEETSAKEAAEKALAELRMTLQQERGRAKRLEEDLSTMRSELENRSLEVAKATEETGQIRRTAENGFAKLRSLLKEEHERADRLAQELSQARTKVFAYEAKAAANDEAGRTTQSTDGGSKELQELLRQERARSSRLEQELATARRTLETRTAVGRSTRTPPAWELGARLLGSSQQQFRQSLPELAATPNKAKAPSTDLSVVTAGAIARVPPIETQTASAARLAAGSGDLRLEHEQAAELVRLIARASGLLGQGDIGAARAVLERASELGSAQASFALAETYDPNILVKWGAYGTRGDAIKAREFYARAEAGGIKEAKERLDALE